MDITYSIFILLYIHLEGFFFSILVVIIHSHKLCWWISCCSKIVCATARWRTSYAITEILTLLCLFCKPDERKPFFSPGIVSVDFSNHTCVHIFQTWCQIFFMSSFLLHYSFENSWRQQDNVNRLTFWSWSKVKFHISNTGLKSDWFSNASE